MLRRKMAQAKDKDCLPLGQRNFLHIFHTDLGQPSALYEVDNLQKLSNTAPYYFSIVRILLGSATLR